MTEQILQNSIIDNINLIRELLDKMLEDKDAGKDISHYQTIINDRIQESTLLGLLDKSYLSIKFVVDKDSKKESANLTINGSGISPEERDSYLKDLVENLKDARLIEKKNKIYPQRNGFKIDNIEENEELKNVLEMTAKSKKQGRAR